MTIIMLEKKYVPDNTLNVLYYLQIFLQIVCYKKRIAFRRTCYTKALKPTLYIFSSEAIVHAHICWIMKA